MAHGKLNKSKRKPKTNNPPVQTTMGDLISALQDVTNDDRLVAMAFGDLTRRGVVNLDEHAVMQAWLAAPEHLRNA